MQIQLTEPMIVQVAVPTEMQISYAKITGFTISDPPASLQDRVRINIRWIIFSPATEFTPEILYVSRALEVPEADIPGLLFSPVSGLAVDAVHDILMNYLVTNGHIPQGVRA